MKTTIQEYKNYLLTNETKENCPVRRTLDLLSGKWKTTILHELWKNSPLRFGELKEKIPKITNTMLITALRDLEKTGIVNREQFNEIPPHVEYSLSQKGRELLPVFYEIAQWGEKNLQEL